MIDKKTMFLLAGSLVLLSNIAWSQGYGSDRMLNIAFASIGHSAKTGPAVVGNPGDYWNPVHPVEGYNYQTDTDKINDVTKRGLKFANGRPSSITLRMVNLGGGWAGPWAIHDPMFNNINYQYDIYRGNNGQPAFMYISDIHPGSYDLYLYGPIGRYQVSVNGRPYGRKDSSQNEEIVNNATQWVEGVHYQVFSDMIITPHDQIEIDLIPSDNRTHDAPISGLQLVPSGTPIVNGVLYGMAAKNYIQQHDIKKQPIIRRNPIIVIHRDPFIPNYDRCDGCSVSGSCVPIGYRTSSNYCDAGGKLYDLKAISVQCNNNFECLSNLCIEGQCS